MTETITIEVSGKEHLVRHIAHLQDVITRKNQRIEYLETQLGLNNKDEAILDAERKAYKKGWKAANVEMREVVHSTIVALKNLDHQAFRVYLEGEKK